MQEAQNEGPIHNILSKTDPVSIILYSLKIINLYFILQIASLPLQIFLVYDKKLISWIFFFVTFFVGFYKVYMFNLPHQKLEVEFLILVAYQFINQIRLYIGIKTNKTERGSFTAILGFVVLSIFTILCLVFFLLLQTYTLLIEFLFCGLALLFSLI